MRRTLYCALCAVVLCVGALCASATTVTGTIKVNGTPFTGYMVVQLNYPGTTGSYINLPAPSGHIPISNGTFAALALDGNDTMLPSKTYYSVTLYGSTGAAISRLAYYITGATFDLGAAVPTPVLTNNVNFLDLLGIRNFSAQNATFTNSITFGTGMGIGPNGITNAKSIMGIRYSDAFHQQNPGSTSCGIQEALADLPSGGMVVLQPGPCNLTSTVNISKSNVILQGQSSTSFSQTGSGVAGFAIYATAGAPVSNVTLRDFSITGSAASTDLIQLENAGNTAFLSDVTIDNVWASSSPSGSSVSVLGNLTGLRISNSHLASSQHGLYVRATLGFSISKISLGPALVVSGNSGDGIDIVGPGVSPISARDISVYSNGAAGVDVESSAISCAFLVSNSYFKSNPSANVLLAGGGGHSISSSSFDSSAYGINISTVSGPTYQALSVRDSFFTSNTTNDLFVAAGVPYVVWYPQYTQSATISDTSGVVHYVNASVAAPVTSADYYSSTNTACTLTSTDSHCTGTLSIPAGTFVDASFFPQLTANSMGTSNDLTISVNGTLGVTSVPYTMSCTFNCTGATAQRIYLHAHHN